MNKIWKLFENDIGIDLGTANTRVFVRGKGRVLDEPTVGADFNSAEAILHLIAHLKSLGCGIVLTSHREGDLEKTCDRIVTLEKGRLV